MDFKKATREKGYWSHLRVSTSPEVGLGGIVGTLRTEYPGIQGLSQDKGQGMHAHTATWPVALSPTSQHGRAPALPHVHQLWTPPPSSDGLWRYHVSHSSRPHLPAREGSGVVTCFMTLNRLWAMRINNNNPGRTARVARYRGKCACYQGKPSSCTSKTCGRRRIKYLQDVQTDGCRAATVQRPPVNHS
jgi:hypothetical protein